MKLLWMLGTMFECAFAWKLGLPQSDSAGLFDVGLEGPRFVAAFGDFNSDKLTDVFVVDDVHTRISVFLCDVVQIKYVELKNATITLLEGEKTVNVVPLDYNQDGKLDLLVSFRMDGDSRYHHRIYLGNGLFFYATVEQLPDTDDEMSPIDFYGNMAPGLLFSNDKELMVLTLDKQEPLKFHLAHVDKDGTMGLCQQLATPNSNAVVDMDGDCVPDIFLTCISKEDIDEGDFRVSQGDPYLEIWLGTEQGYRLGKRFSFPFRFGDISPISLTDVNGDGSTDILFYTKDHLHVFYNTQQPYCGARSANCKPRTELCVSDPSYGFDFSTTTKHEISVSWNHLFNGRMSIVHTDPYNSTIPLQTSDLDLDGYPDLVIIAEKTDANNPTRQAIILKNIKCTLDLCSKFQTDMEFRTFVVDHFATKQLGFVNHAWAAAPFVFGHLGLAGIIINSFDMSTQKPSVVAVLNPYCQDAFFLCLTVGSQQDQRRAYGVNYPGATFKYSFVDFDGCVRVRSLSQYTQTQRMRLMTPQAFGGLGRINTFIEILHAGVPLRSRSVAHWVNIVPNSNLYLFPPEDATQSWGIQLYINPGKHTLWITMSLVSSLLVLAAMVLMFRRIEQKQDMLERKESLHAINFDAL